jgi:hypothetical protein
MKTEKQKDAEKIYREVRERMIEVISPNISLLDRFERAVKQKVLAKHKSGG